MKFSLLVGLLLVLAGCGHKARSVTAPTIIYADTTRTRLVHRADASADTLTIVRQRTHPNLTNYETAISHYDSIRVALP